MQYPWQDPAIKIPPLSVIGFSSRRVSLRPISRADYKFLFKCRVDVDSLYLWSNRRRISSYDEFTLQAEDEFRNAITFVVVKRSNLQPIGFAQAYNLNLTDGWAYILGYLVPEARRGHGAEVAILLLKYLFDHFPLRKVYASNFEYNVATNSMLRRMGFKQEVRAKQHVWYDDRYWDLIRLGCFREDWDKFRPRAMRLVGLEQDE